MAKITFLGTSSSIPTKTRDNTSLINYFNVYKKSSFIELPDIKIQAIKNLHCKNSFGIKVFVDKKSFFYSSDTAFSSKTLKSAGKVELIIHDCTASKSFFETHPSLYKMHTCAQDLADYLENKSNITLIPIHFLYLNINEEKKVKKKLKKLKNRVIFVNDFDKINLQSYPKLILPLWSKWTICN